MRWTENGNGRWCNSFAALGAFLLCFASAAAQTQPVVPPSPMASVQPRFSVVIDAAHGGADTGAKLTPGLMEKDLVLALSVRLRSLLAARGISVITTRESDTTVAADDRAGLANHSMAAACIMLHATTTGSGVHLFTSSLAAVPNGRFLPWQTAQAAYTPQSLRLSSEIASALGHVQVPVTLGRASVPPMDNFTCPAVAVELAPLAHGNTTRAAPLTDSAYQTRIVEALAAALEQWRSDWRQQP